MRGFGDDDIFLSGFAGMFTYYLFAVVVGLGLWVEARADVSDMPPSSEIVLTKSNGVVANAPTGTNIEYKYNGSAGVLSYDKNGKPVLKGQFEKGKVAANGSTFSKSNTFSGTDGYGNTAKGTVRTQTTSSMGAEALNKASTGLMAGVVAGNIANSSHFTQAGAELGQGNYAKAAAHAAAAMDWTGLGNGIYNFFEAWSQAANAKDGSMQDAARKAAEAKAQAAVQAAEAARQAYEANDGYKQFLPDPKTGLPAKYPSLIKWGGYSNGAVLAKDYTTSGLSVAGYSQIKVADYPAVFVGELKDAVKQKCIDGGCEIYWNTIQVNKDNYHQYKADIEEAINREKPQITLEDIFLTQQEIAQVIGDYLQKHIEVSEDIAAAIGNLLWANGQLNADNTKTTVSGSLNDNTFKTPPYTPQGQNQAQETGFTVLPNGDVRVSAIPRPDLTPNSPQAPSRTKGGGKKRGDDDDGGLGDDDDTGKPKEDDKDSTGKKKDDKDDDEVGRREEDEKKEKEEICDDGSTKIICLEAGSDKEKDWDLPVDEVDFDFKKTEYFEEDGSCPPPVKFNFMGEFEVSLEPFCDYARGISYVWDFLGLMTAIGIVYATVKEL